MSLHKHYLFQTKDQDRAMTKLYSLVVLYKGETAAHILKVLLARFVAELKDVNSIFCRLAMTSPASVFSSEAQPRTSSPSPPRSWWRGLAWAPDRV